MLYYGHERRFRIQSPCASRILAAGERPRRFAPGRPLVPRVVAAAGDRAARRFLEFFAVTIEDPNTREAYFRACRRFFAWTDARGLKELIDIEPMQWVRLR